MTDTINNGIPLVSENTIDPAAGLNEALNVADALIQVDVISLTVTAPPASPSVGDRYIVPTGATGAWSGQAGKLARWEEGLFWAFYNAQFVTNNGVAYTKTSGGWAVISGSGEANTTSNLGTGEGVAAPKSGVNLPFKSLKAGANVTITSDANEITISSSGGGGGGGQVDSVVAGEGITVDNTDPENPEVSVDFSVAEYKLTAGANITIDRTDPDAPVISATGGGGGGDVVGPSSATPNALAQFDGETGKLLKSGPLVADFATAAQGALADTAVQPGAAGRAALSVREQLTANRTYYVRTDGSDSNNGMTNTAGGAFLTIQKAVDVVSALDIGVFNVTIGVEPSGGGYDVGSGVQLKSLVGSGVVTIRGNGSSPVDTQIFSSGSLLATEAVFFAAGITGSWRITNVGIYSVGSGVKIGIQASAGSMLTAGNIDYGTGFTSQARAIDSGSLEIDSNYSISGGAGSSLAAVGSAVLRAQNVSVTITGTPTFGSFCLANQSGVLIATGNTFIGSATGQRFNATLNGVINSGGAGLSYFPGSVDGANASGGQYV